MMKTAIFTVVLIFGSATIGWAQRTDADLAETMTTKMQVVASVAAEMKSQDCPILASIEKQKACVEASDALAEWGNAMKVVLPYLGPVQDRATGAALFRELDKRIGDAKPFILESEAIRKRRK